MRILVTGGVKSGKSRHALDLARAYPSPRCFIATAEALDGEMEARIAAHRAERGAEFSTIEEPVDLPSALEKAVEAGAETTVVDCLPLWVCNVLGRGLEAEFDERLDALAAALPASCVVVTNETGLGNIPFDAETRRYNRLLAEANRRIAEACDRVVLMVCGIPLRVKG